MTAEMPIEHTRSAFLDESGSDWKLDPNTYILAAAICQEHMLDSVRKEMATLKLRGQVKVHWRNESDKRRQVIAEAIAALPIECLVVVRDSRTGERAERRRRHCLERMLYELSQREVISAVFESRGPKDDERDLVMLQTLRTRRAVSARLRMEHKAGPQDALLCVADATCGAVVRDRTGDSSYLNIIRAGVPVEIVTIGSR